MYLIQPQQSTSATSGFGEFNTKSALISVAVLAAAGGILWWVMRSPSGAPSSGSYKPNKGRKLTKSKLVRKVAEAGGVEAKEVRAALQGLQTVVAKQLGPGGSGEVTIPGIAKLKRKNVKAKKRRKGTNPFTGEEQWFKAKPATRKVRATILKPVREAAAKKPRRRV